MAYPSRDGCVREVEAVENAELRELIARVSTRPV
jgi:hypothetical protein